MDGFTVDHSVKVDFCAFGLGLSLYVTAFPKWYIDRDTTRYSGRVQVGESVSFFTRCVPGGKPIIPDSPGSYRIYSPGGFPAVRSGMLPVETTDAESVGIARGSFVPDNRDGAGMYIVLFSFVTSGLPRGEIINFELIKAGHQLGHVFSLFPVSRPDATSIVAHSGSGKVITAREPYLDEGV